MYSVLLYTVALGTTTAWEYSFIFLHICNPKSPNHLWKCGWSKFRFWPLSFSLSVSIFLFNMCHCLSCLSQALFLSLFWQVLAGWSGDRGQINTQSNSCELESSVCVYVCVRTRRVSADVVILLVAFFPSSVAHPFFLNGSVDEKLINIYCTRTKHEVNNII